MQAKNRDEREILDKIIQKLKEFEKNKAIMKLHEVKPSKSFLNTVNQCSCQTNSANSNFVSNNSITHSN